MNILILHYKINIDNNFNIGDFKMKRFKVGQSVIKVNGEIKKISRVVKAAYYCYYLECEEGYYVESDLKKA